uniref:zinc finger CCCH domain-containing protein 49-like n=1 Tax=Erigeron canadensis TaxID=72917 RepID=UPI001CB9CE75|nr:zinc finger CCCH domain-containing protein 49-like [Erigeron canadensis]
MAEPKRLRAKPVSTIPVQYGSGCGSDNVMVGATTKENFGKECKICTRPFTVFRLKPGRDARYKKSEICRTCSKLKNVCQICLLDLEYGLPVQVCDTALSINSNDSIPKSDVNREYFAEEHDRRARTGLDYESSYRKEQPNETILKLQRTTPYYKRNKAHICSFFVRGECTRGTECPYRHEMPVTGELSQQIIKDRDYGVNDPVALKLLNKAGEMPSLEPPEDESIRTLYVGGIDARVSEQDLKLMWGRPPVPKTDGETYSNEVRRHAVAHQQNQFQPPGAAGSQERQQPPQMHYFNIPPPVPQHGRAFYPCMDPERMGAVIRAQEGSGASGSGSGPDQRHQGGPELAAYPPPSFPSQDGGHYYPLYFQPGPPPSYGSPLSYQQYPPLSHPSTMPPPGPNAEQPYQQKAPADAAVIGPLLPLTDPMY